MNLHQTEQNNSKSSAVANNIGNQNNSEQGISLMPPEIIFSAENIHEPANELFQLKEDDRKEIPNFLQVWNKNQDNTPIQRKQVDKKEPENFIQMMIREQKENSPIQQKTAEDNISNENSGNTKQSENFMIQMQKSFQTDFSDVNIHENSKTAENLGALAFTQGNNVHFAPGQFKPDTMQGKELIGHEFAHVVQQRQGKVQANKQIGKFKINDNSALEKQADEMGKKAANNQLVSKSNKIENQNINTGLTQLKEEEIKNNFLKLDGDIIWIYYKEDGKTTKIKYDPNMQIQGSKFLQNTIINLHKIYATDKGEIIINKLLRNNVVINIHEAWGVLDTDYDFNENKLEYDDNPWITGFGGGDYNDLVGLSHELYHSYQDSQNLYPNKDNIKDLERGAVEFANYIRSVYGMDDMRTSYKTYGLKFNPDEKTYNPKMEKILDFGYKQKWLIKPQSIPIGVDRNNISNKVNGIPGDQNLHYKKTYKTTNEKFEVDKILKK